MIIKQNLKEGMVLYSSCTDNSPVCYHVGIVHKVGDKIRVYHNHPLNLNRYGGTVCAETFENFSKDRYIIKMVKTHVKNEDIVRVARMCKSEVWDSLLFNCEDFVLQITDGERRSDIRDVAKIAALGASALLLL